jgi:hypothetical protein
VESSFFLSFYVFVSVVHLSLFSIHVQLHAKLSAAIDIEISFKQDHIVDFLRAPPFINVLVVLFMFCSEFTDITIKCFTSQR